MNPTSLTNATPKTLLANNNIKPSSSSASLVSTIFHQVQKDVPHTVQALALQPLILPPATIEGEMPNLKPKEKELLQEMFSKWPLNGGSLIDLFGLAIFEKWEALFNMSFLEPHSMPNQREHYQYLRDLFDSRFVICYYTIINNTAKALPSSSQRFFLEAEVFANVVCSTVLTQILEKKFIIYATTGATQAKAKLADQKWARVKERAQQVHDVIALLQKFLRSCPVLLSSVNAFPQNTSSNPAKSLEAMKAYCYFADHYFKIGGQQANVTGFYDPLFLDIPKMIDAFLKSPRPATWAPIDQWFFDKMLFNGDAQHYLYFHLSKATSEADYTYKKYCKQNQLEDAIDLSREDFLSSLSAGILSRQVENMFLMDIYKSFVRLIDSKKNASEFPCFSLYLTRLSVNFSIILKTYHPYNIESQTAQNEAEWSLESLFNPIREVLTAICMRVIRHFSADHFPLMLQACDVIEQKVQNSSLVISAFSGLKKGRGTLPPIIDTLPSTLQLIPSVHQMLVKILKEGKESGAIKAEDRDTIRQMLIDDALFVTSFVMFLQDANWLYGSKPDDSARNSLPGELMDFLLLEEFDEIFQEPESEKVEETLPTETPSLEIQQASQKQEEKVTEVYAKTQHKIQKKKPNTVPASHVASKPELEVPSKQEILKATKLRKLNKLLKKYGYDQSEPRVGSHTKVFNQAAGDMIVEPRRLKKGLLNSFYKQLHSAWESSQKKA